MSAARKAPARRGGAKSGPAAAAGYSTRSRLDKLGIQPGARIALVGLEDAAFLRELKERTGEIAVGRPRARSDAILLRVDGPKELARLGPLQKSMARDGAIWAIWPKGQEHIGENAIREAALAHGLVDVKVIAFSETLSGLKLVIPVAKR